MLSVQKRKIKIQYAFVYRHTETDLLRRFSRVPSTADHDKSTLLKRKSVKNTWSAYNWFTLLMQKSSPTGEEQYVLWKGSPGRKEVEKKKPAASPSHPGNDRSSLPSVWWPVVVEAGVCLSPLTCGHGQSPAAGKSGTSALNFVRAN